MSDAEIKIGPQTFKVVIVENLKNKEGQELAGSILYNFSKIEIDSESDEFHRRQTLWHEITHALFQQKGIDHDEKVVDALAYGIIQVLDDNKGKV